MSAAKKTSRVENKVIYGKPYNRRREVTPSTALRLARFFGISPDFWINLQLRWVFCVTRQPEIKMIEATRPYKQRIGTAIK
jgi:plasmid maintenance system antidote protein VapI